MEEKGNDELMNEIFMSSAVQPNVLKKKKVYSIAI